MEQNLSPLMSFWDDKGPAYTTAFRSREHRGVEIHYQTFSTQDYGIVYAFTGNSLIFTNSFEAAKAAIEALQNAQTSFKPPASLSQGGPPSLSLEQAVGQVLMIGFEDSTLTPELEDLVKRLRPGGVLLLSKNIKSTSQLQKLTQDLQRISLQYSQVPLFIAVDQEGGAISRIGFAKEKTAQATIGSEEEAYQVGRQRARELTSLGVNLNLSPVLDTTNPNDFLFDRTFQTNRIHTGKLAKALLAGQKEAGILSTLKHFPGYGNIAFNPEHRLATVSEFPDISPFALALPENPEFLLLANVVYTEFDTDNPFTFSEKGMKLLRNDLRFEGIILTDDLVQPALLDNYSLQEIVQTPLAAGVTMVMFSKQTYAQDAHETLLRTVQENPALRHNVEQAAAKVLDMKALIHAYGK